MLSPLAAPFSRTVGTNETFAYDKTGNRLVGQASSLPLTVVGKANRVQSDGTFAYLYDTEGNLTRKSTSATGAYVQYSWDHRDQLTKVEFYNAPVSGVSALAKTVEFVYDVDGDRISKKLTVTGQSAVTENYLYDGDQLVAVLNSAGAITHETFDGPSLDQVFADQTTLSGVLWPLEDRAGSVRDVVNSFLSPLPPIRLRVFACRNETASPQTDWGERVRVRGLSQRSHQRKRGARQTPHPA